MAAGVPMTVLAAAAAAASAAEGAPQAQPARAEPGRLQAGGVAAGQPPPAAATRGTQALGMLSEEEKAGMSLLGLRESGSGTEENPMDGVEGPVSNEIQNTAGNDHAMLDMEVRNAAVEQPWVSGSMSTTIPVRARVTETKYRPESLLKDVRGLLSTGLLEGFRVTYRRNQVERTGRIRGQGYSCGCLECGYSNIMNACEFEQHSGESSNNQNDHIFLDSGISLFRVIQALKYTRLYVLGDCIEEEIGLRPNFIQYENWKASFQLEKDDSDAAASDPCSTQSSQESFAGKTSHMEASALTVSLKESTSNGSSILNWSGFKRRSDRQLKRGGTDSSTPTLSRSPDKETSGLSTGNTMKNETEETPCENTAGPLSTDGTKHVSAGSVPLVSTSSQHDLVIASPLTSPVNVIQEPGQTQDHGVESNSKDSGQPKVRDNTLHPMLFKEGGLPDHTLLTYMLKSGEVLKQGYKRGAGIVCDCCNEEFTPSHFEDHAGMGRRRQPYRSIYTSDGLTLHELAKKLQDGSNSIGTNSANFSVIDELPALTSDHGKKYSTTSRPIIVPLKRTLERVVKTESCYVCRDGHTMIGVLSADMIVFCNQCERPCHVKCYNSGVQKPKAPLKILGEYFQFHFMCCEKCQSLRTSLHQGLKKSEEIAFLRKTRSSICWQLLSGMYMRSDVQQYMYQAIAIFKDAFAETTTLGSDIIQDMVNSKDVGGEDDFRGVYCAVLTTSAFVVSAAILKVRTEEVAELILIATRNECRKKGYFVLLLRLIEAHLRGWNIKLLVAPVDPEMSSIWSEKLGFTVVSDEEKKSRLEAQHMLMFENLSLVEKSLA